MYKHKTDTNRLKTVRVGSGRVVSVLAERALSILSASTDAFIEARLKLFEKKKLGGKSQTITQRH